MNEIRISDVTMKQTGRAAGFTLTFKEKIELSKLLDRLGVSVVELETIQNPKIDSLLVKSVAAAVRHCAVAVPVQLSEESVQTTWNALREAACPRLQVAAPVSPVQMEYLHHKKPEAMLSAIRETVAACRACCGDVEFLADDATRSDEEFLHAAVSAAIEAGASTVTVCDTAGAMLPDEFAAFLQKLYAAVPALRGVCLGVSCADTLSMADSCAIAAVRCGAGEVKVASYPVGTAALENVARVLAAKGDKFDACCAVRMTEMKRILSQIVWMCQTNRSKNSPFDNGVEESGESVTLTSHDEMSAVLKAVARLGYDLSEEDGVKVYEAFCRIADRKERVGSKELDAIVAAAALQVPPTYKMESYVINTGNIITATAHMKLRRQDRVLEGISVGDGPIDAAFLAIEQIAGRHYELDDFQIQAVTEGREAMGQTVVKLRSNGKLYSGRGISTDILGASILAYLSALNKIVYEEAEV
ncbi:MAG: alpha-isopropylmalate synthase regulatory domain-containing protein [Oscillospiraceae bacterium]|nr:alpha-isopropylmalate synthase regulatory domain-containing protein [Oscillospiraceae bacterium]